MKNVSSCESFFFSGKQITDAYLLKILITLNKKRTPILDVLINCISARSAPEIFFMKRDCNFL